MSRKRSLEDLVNESLHLLKDNDYDRASAPLFQRRLRLDYVTAVKVVEALQMEGYLVNGIYDDEDDEPDHVVFEVNKEKLSKIFKN